MSQKKSTAKKGKTEIPLSREEADELQMIVDRLLVQNPEGESFERYLQSMGNTLGSRPHMAAALVEQLSKNPGKTGFLTFCALEGLIRNSAHKRHLKQAAYRFSQRGFTCAGEAPAPEKVVLIQGEARHPAAHLFLVSGTLWLVSAHVPEPGPGSGYLMLSAFLEKGFDIYNVKVSDGSQKWYRDYLKTVTRYAPGSRPMEIPIWHAARLFFEMLDMWTGKDRTAQIEHVREIFGRYHEPDRKPYVYDLMPAIEDPERLLPEVDVDRLLEGMDLSWLSFAREELAPFHEKLKELDSPVLVISREIQAERTRALIRGAADSLYAGRKRDLFRRFFEERAMAFKLLSEEEKANWAWTVACHLAGGGSAGDNPVARELVIEAIEHHWPEDAGKEGPAEHGAAHERRTESGIILP